MDFEQVVEAFRRKKNARTRAEEKREEYKKTLKEFNKLRYGYNKDGERVQRPVTQERIERREEAKNRVVPDVTNELLDFVKETK